MQNISAEITDDDVDESVDAVNDVTHNLRLKQVSGETQAHLASSFQTGACRRPFQISEQIQPAHCGQLQIASAFGAWALTRSGMVRIVLC